MKDVCQFMYLYINDLKPGGWNHDTFCMGSLSSWQRRPRNDPNSQAVEALTCEIQYGRGQHRETIEPIITQSSLHAIPRVEEGRDLRSVSLRT